MHRSSLFVPTSALLGALLLLPQLAVAQKPAANPAPARKSAAPNAIKAAPADPAIAAALKQVSAERIRATIEKLVSFGNRSTLSSDQPAGSGHGITAARDWIKGQFEQYSKACGGCLKVKLDTFTQQSGERVTKPTEISNVYAVLKGTDPDQAKQIVLVTGHYDSRNGDNYNTTDPAPGANDDGSGTAVSLECARVLSQHKFPGTIIFLTVAGEEQGLYGSKHFAAMAKDNKWHIDAVLNNDIVGGNRTPGDTEQNPNTVRVFSEAIPATATENEINRIRYLGGENDSPSRELARYVAETARTYLPASFQPTLIYRTDRYLRGGDHESFNEQGFAAVRFTEWREDYNHQHQDVRVEKGVQYGDLPKFVDFNYVANVARVNAATLASLASAPAAPEGVKVETKQLENNTTLVWPSQGGEEASEGSPSYEILWRDTDAAEWQHAKEVESCNSILEGDFRECRVTVPISKDNVIFAVRSLDENGHRSLPVIPVPER